MPIYTKGDVKILHVHTPKTGGTSIMKLFEMDGFEVSYYIPRSVKPCSPQHYHYNLYRKEFNFKEIDYSFSIYRDPLSRFRSQFRFENKKRVTANKPRLKWLPWTDNTLKNYRKNNFIQDNHIRPQSQFFYPYLDVYSFSKLKDIPTYLHEKGILSELYDIPHVQKTKHTPLNNRFDERIKNFYREDYRWAQNNNLI